MHPIETDRPSAPTEATDHHADVPRLEGWEDCHLASREEVARFLHEAPFHSSEIDPRRIESIRFVGGEAPRSPDGAELLGQTLPLEDPATGAHRAYRIEIYRHEGRALEGSLAQGQGTDGLFTPDGGLAAVGPEADRTEIYRTLTHELGHPVWDNASEEERRRWASRVDATRWGEHPDRPSLSPNADRDPREHFCEAFAATMVSPRDLDALDSARPDEGARGVGVQRLRESASGSTRSAP